MTSWMMSIFSLNLMSLRKLMTKAFFVLSSMVRAPTDVAVPVQTDISPPVSFRPDLRLNKLGKSPSSCFAGDFRAMPLTSSEEAAAMLIWTWPFLFGEGEPMDLPGDISNLSLTRMDKCCSSNLKAPFAGSLRCRSKTSAKLRVCGASSSAAPPPALIEATMAAIAAAWRLAEKAEAARAARTDSSTHSLMSSMVSGLSSEDR
mmetsp:Transcript_43926/g.124172  ORF Transcript_43926/g.124172 Transcript_43926/m.124172 type:complete len:203 (-) Transcript_43926:37-645(-)